METHRVEEGSGGYIAHSLCSSLFAADVALDIYSGEMEGMMSDKIEGVGNEWDWLKDTALEFIEITEELHKDQVKKHDELTAARAEIERLRTALSVFADRQCWLFNTEARKEWDDVKALVKYDIHVPPESYALKALAQSGGEGMMENMRHKCEPELEYVCEICGNREDASNVQSQLTTARADAEQLRRALTTEAESLEKWKKMTLEARAEIERLRDCLISISRNSCCGQCQEAKLWADKALAQTGGEGES